MTVHAGCNMIYGAMFDEVNEGTAMYKLVPTPAQLPAQGDISGAELRRHNSEQRLVFAVGQSGRQDVARRNSPANRHPHLTPVSGFANL